MKLCPLCHSVRRKLVYASTIKSITPAFNQYLCTSNSYGLHGPIYKCTNCGLLYIVDNTPVKSILNRYQEAVDPVYISQEPARIKTFARNLTKLNNLKPKRGKLLDIGAYTGLFLSLAQKSGWRISGVEPSRWAVDQAQKMYGIKIRNGLLSPRLFRTESIDVVTMWDVIEHFTDPKSAVKIAQNYLKPDGVLAITTIDVDSLAAKILKHRWPWLMRMHRVYFSQNTLKKLLENNGFRVVSITPHIRYTSLGYLASRFNTNLIGKLLTASGLDRVVIPFYIGDLFDLYAVKK